MSNKKKFIPIFPAMGVFCMANRVIVGGEVKDIDINDIKPALAPYLASLNMKRTLECVLVELRAAKEGKTDLSDKTLDYIARMVMASLVCAGMTQEEIEKMVARDIKEIYGE